MNCCIRVLTLVALALVVAVPFGFGQDSPNLETGLKPFGAYQGGDLDSVSLTNGNLFLHIPIISYPQRGNLRLSFSIGYNNKGWKLVTTSVGTRTTSKWSFLGAGVGTLWDQKFTLVANSLCDGCTNEYNLVSADGSSHQLGATTATHTSYIWESLDASGFRFEESSPDSGTGWIIDRNGTRFKPGAPPAFFTTVFQEDANGNQISVNSTGWTDSLGRVIAGTGLAGQQAKLGFVTLGTSTTDYTNCPTGTYSASLINFPGPNGGASQMKACYARQPVTTTNWCVGIQNCTEGNAAVTTLTRLILPDLTHWDFSLDGNGNLTQVSLPMGGSISYTWQPFLETSSPSTASNYVATRSLNANDGSGARKWTYTWPANPERLPFTVIVTDPLGNDAVHTISNIGTDSRYETKAQSYSGSSISGGTLLKTVTTEYTSNTNPYRVYFGGPGSINVLPWRITTIFPNGKVRQVQKVYDSGATFVSAGADGNTYPLVYGSVLKTLVYDYGQNTPGVTDPAQISPGPLLRETDNHYLWQDDSNYLNLNLLNLMQSSVVPNGGSSCPSGNPYGYSSCAYTDYQYDQSTLAGSGITTQHDSNPVTGARRGNLTTVRHWLDTNSTYLSSTTTYFDTGKVASTTDPGGHTKNLSYSSTYVGAYLTQTQLPDTSSPNLAHHITSATYDLNTGLVASRTDENSRTTQYSYDNMWRLTQIGEPDGGQANYYYPDVVTVELKRKIDSTRTTDAYARVDGLGREIRRVTANGEAVPYDQVDTCYDADGHKSFASYPYQGQGLTGTTQCSTPGDSFAYDGMGRTTTVTHSDGTTVTHSYGNGTAASLLDEGNGTARVQHITQGDGLGRLVSVCEVTSATQLGSGNTPATCGLDITGTGFLTTYQYDVLGNLKGVSQGTLNPRSFTYDSVSRLVSASNPESGVTTYGYDADGNVITRVRPKPNQTSALTTVTATMQYDPLHRLTSETYNDATTPSVSLGYDETSVYGVTLANPTGRKTSEKMTSSSGTLQSAGISSYDTMGQVTYYGQCTVATCPSLPTSGLYAMNYTYDLLGDMLTGSNGVGITFSYNYNIAGRLTSMTSSLSDTNHPGTPLSNLHYGSFGLSSESLGNGLTESLGYTPRGHLQSISVLNSGNTSLYNLNLTYEPDGDVATANDSVNGNWSYAYDGFNRLGSASKTGLGFSYGYDRYGNRWQQNVTAGSGPAPQFSFDANNRISGAGSTCTSGTAYCYDAAGNLLNDGLGHTYSFDAENRITSTGGSTTTSNVYGLDGRVRKTTSSGTVDYLYDVGRHQTVEMNSSGTWTRAEIYAGGHHVGTYSGGVGGTTYFTHADNLGTERVRTTAAGASYETCTNLPFGDGQSCTGTDVDPMHFTGKQRDPETNLDDFGARYFASGLGRWMIADWSAAPEPIPFASLTNPQSLNLYVFVGNNPVTDVDSNGHGKSWPNEPLLPHPESIDISAATEAQGDELDLIAQNMALAQNNGNARTREFSTTPGSISVADGKAAYSAAVDYLRTDPTMKGVVDKFEAGHTPVVFINDGNDRVQGGTLYWDPHSGLNTTSGGKQSPALGLGHEMTHDTGRWLGTLIRSMIPDAHYDNLEERRVIQRFETPAAIHLGEGTRTDHWCAAQCFFWAASPTDH